MAHLVLTYTRFGRYVYMVGGNREAAEYSGVNVKLIIASVMVISAMCSGIAGMLGVAYFGSAQQNQFDTFLLDAIAAVVVGGTSLFGGRGGIGNTIIGLLVLGVLNNGLDHIQIDSFLKILIRGLILLERPGHQRLRAEAAGERARIGSNGSRRTRPPATSQPLLDLADCEPSPETSWPGLRLKPSAMPRSVISPVTRRAGVTSKAGFRAGVAFGRDAHLHGLAIVVRGPRRSETSSPERSSMGISFNPSATVQSMVGDGSPT